MGTPFELASAALDELILWVNANSKEVERNEATTRLHLVDRILTEVLAWPREEIEAEASVEGEYLDYRLGRPMVRMVLEAKREGRSFSIPPGSTAMVQKLRPLLTDKAGENLREAVTQVMGYCGNSGVPLAVACNGLQLVAFLGSRQDGVAPLNGSALVFPSLASMRDNFRLLWDNLSKFGVEARRINLTLREGEKPAPPEPLASSIPGYPGRKDRNAIQTELEILADVFLEDITRIESLEEKFLEDTYATSGALSQYAMVSRQILDSRYSLLQGEDANFSVASATNKKGIAKELPADVVAAALSKRPIILLGDVGVGKTMFIRRLISVDAKEYFDDAISVYIDFGRRPALLSEVDDFVAEEAERQLLNKYGIDIQEAGFVEAVYNGDLNRFDKGVAGKLRELDPRAYGMERIQFLGRLIANRGEHLKACLNHLRGTTRKQIVIFLDNIDQRDFDFQERVFLLSESLADDWPATVFVSLRPDTFYHSKNEGALTAYLPRVFTIGPPRVDVVLKKRLQFALDQIRNPELASQMGPNVRIESETLASYLEVLLQNFASNEQLITLVANLADGNMRRALDFIRSFVGSGHVNTLKILDIYKEHGRYTIPIHEFLQAVIFGDSAYYTPQASPVANLFDISEPDGREHFPASFMITFAQSAGEKACRTCAED